jgi:hypothetical protein
MDQIHSSNWRVFIFARQHNPVIFFVKEEESITKEESLIDRDSGVFDTEITFSPISVSKSNFKDSVGKHILFLKVSQASITPYIVEVVFPFPEFISWCVEQYSYVEKVILNKVGS